LITKDYNKVIEKIKSDPKYQKSRSLKFTQNMKSNYRELIQNNIYSYRSKQNKVQNRFPRILVHEPNDDDWSGNY
jgi:hypothetical protein